MPTGTPDILDNQAVVCGRIVEIHAPVDYGVNGKSKRVVVIETSGKWAQTVPVEFHGKNQEKLSALAEDDIVRVVCNVQGRRWNDKIFLTLTGWKVAVLAHGMAQPAPEPSNSPTPAIGTPPTPATAPVPVEERGPETDNLPF